ncbi:hypothetical protein O181_029163 [Austropuccinia psidii MF-1]|uniref:Uncharacterized protein n=1 Tax=Austropuccinia psidii MF-1 TaxID=1389203 RepID=A0A9Q3CV76_9BASI|nr:hypothetical protein [Austropuccinia psidii MF-1]
METCAVSKLEHWKELPVGKEPSSNNQEISEEHPHQVFKEEEIKESEDKREIKVELASVKIENINSKPKERNLKGISTSRKKDGNTFNQISQTINSDHCKNLEDIRIKSLIKLLSPIKLLKSLSKGICRNNWKSSIKPIMTTWNLTTKARNLSSKHNKLALDSLK